MVFNSVKSKELETSFIRLLKGDILVIEVKPDCEVSLREVQEMIVTAGELGEQKKLKNLIIAGPHSTLSPEATQYMKSEEAHRFTKLEAIVISSLAQRIVGNFYLGIVSKRRPSKLFNSTEKAIQWLQEHN